MKDSIQCYKPLIIILLEPRISSIEADEACSCIGKKTWVHSEAIGFSGGIWMLWNRDDITLRLQLVEKYFIHLLVSLGDGSNWELTIVYASPQSNLRSHP